MPHDSKDNWAAWDAEQRLLGHGVTHHKPPNGLELANGGSSADTYYCDWCKRNVRMAEMRSHGGAAYWSYTQDLHGSAYCDGEDES